MDICPRTGVLEETQLGGPKKQAQGVEPTLFLHSKIDQSISVKGAEACSLFDDQAL